MNAPGTSVRVFWGCAAALIGALVWITIHALRLEERDAMSQASASRQEATRLALWRMDSALTPVIAREASRPYFHYQSFYPTDRAFTRMLDEVKPGDVLVPSPLLDAPVGVIRVYFQIDPAGQLTSPQVPRGDQRRIAEPSRVSPTNIVAAEDQLSTLSSLWSRQTPASPVIALDSASKPDASGGDVPSSTPTSGTEDPSASAAPAGVPARSTIYSETETALKNEFDQRQERLALANTSRQAPENMAASRAVERGQARRQAGSPEGSTPAPADPSLAASAAGDVRTGKPGARDELVERSTTAGEGDRKDELPGPATPGAYRREGEKGDGEYKLKEAPGPVVTASLGTPLSPVAMSDLRPAWIGPANSPQLVFTRNVVVNGESFDQGFWMDWQLTRSWLLSGIGDLLPWADLVPVREDVRTRPADALGRTLASIPAELVVRDPLAPASIGWTPLRWGLLLSWLAIGASLVITWRVLLALHDLAERRGRFAAAVTHELRTPLTTFCLYTQMLADDMVPAARQPEYLSTMRQESTRLAGIVESVLEYARLGRKPAGHAVQQVELRGMLEPLIEKLGSLAQGNGFELKADISQAAGVLVRADPMGVERVLTNLVDNACKYARGHTPMQIELTVTPQRRHALITVRDHGRGLTAEEAARVFEPYFRGPRTTDLGVPGLGLGLALAKGVARGMGGDLRHASIPGSGGAAFSLVLGIVG